jgi:putative intracellular protease/amidase
MTTPDITSKLPASRPEEKQSAHTDPQCLHPTGLWLSELTHARHVFEECRFEQQLVSPNGGAVPLEPRARKFPSYDKTAKGLARRSHPDGIVGQQREPRSGTQARCQPT